MPFTADFFTDGIGVGRIRKPSTVISPFVGRFGLRFQSFRSFRAAGRANSRLNHGHTLAARSLHSFRGELPYVDGLRMRVDAGFVSLDVCRLRVNGLFLRIEHIPGCVCDHLLPKTYSFLGLTFWKGM